MGIFGRFKKQAPPKPPCSAVIVAAGSSTRMGMDKVMLPLCGVPVIVHSIRAFQQAPSVGEVVVVTREDLIAPIAELCREYGLNKVSKVIRGGASRTESVRLGTLEAAADAAVLAVHDGARPLVTVEVIERTVTKALEANAAAPAVPVKDTVKVAVDGVVQSTPDRATLFAVQTPQIFEASLLRAALQKALDDNAAVTDDCSAVERLGMKVVLVPGDEQNIKLTTATDLVLAEGLMEGRL